MRLPPWHTHFDVWLLLGSIWVGYFLLARRHRSRTGEPTPRRQKTFFCLGMMALWAGADWPIHDLAEGYLYSVHMVQHMLFSWIAPPLLIAGMPVWFLRAALRPRPVRRLVRFLTKPVMALVAFNAVLLFTHWPAVVDLSVRSQLVHFGLHLLLFSASLVMWWPVMSPLPEMPSLAPPAQMLYLFLQSLAPTIPASFLAFGSNVLYPAYAAFPRIWGIGPLTDQLIAGLIMKIGGGLIMWGFIATIFFRWHAREERDGLDALQYRNVDRDVRAELMKP
jgi:putative membrane protein